MTAETAQTHEDPEAAYTSGVEHYTAGRAAQAAAAFEQARQQSPDNPGPWMYLGLIALSDDNVEGARNLLEQSIRLDGTTPLVWHYLGVCLERQGAPDQAAQCFRRALRLDPGAELSREALLRVDPSTAQEDAARTGEDGTRSTDTPALSEVYGVYEVLSQSSDPLVRQPLPLMDQVRHDGRAKLSAFTYRFVGGALAGYLLGYVVAQGRQSAKYWGSTSTHRIAATSTIVGFTCLFVVLIVGWLLLVAVTTRYIIERGRIQVISGLILRKHTNLELYRAIDITFTQNIIQRLTGDGTLVVQTATHKLRLVGLSRTSRLRATYQQLLNLVFALRANNYVRGIIS